MKIYFDVQPIGTPKTVGGHARYDQAWLALKSIPAETWMALDRESCGGKDQQSTHAVLRVSARRAGLRIQTLVEGDKVFLRTRPDNVHPPTTTKPKTPSTSLAKPPPKAAKPPTTPVSVSRPVTVVEPRSRAPTPARDHSVVTQQIDTLLASLITLADPEEWMWLKLPDRSQKASLMSQVRVRAQELCPGFKVEMDLDDDDTLYVRLVPAPVQ